MARGGAVGRSDAIIAQSSARFRLPGAPNQTETPPARGAVAGLRGGIPYTSEGLPGSRAQTAMDRRNLQSPAPYRGEDLSPRRGVSSPGPAGAPSWRVPPVGVPGGDDPHRSRSFDVLALGTDEALQEGMFKFVDRDTGRMLRCRADVTPQIARIAATRLRRPAEAIPPGLPHQRVPCTRPRASGACASSTRRAWSCSGSTSRRRTPEMIAMTIEAFRAAGFERFQIDVGHVEFVRGVLESLGVERGGDRRPARGPGAKGCRGVDPRWWGAVRPSVDGGPRCSRCPASRAGRTSSGGRRRSSRIRRSERAVAGLAEVHRLPHRLRRRARRSSLDLGEVRGFDYYSGVSLEGYVDGFGAESRGRRPVRPDAGALRHALPGHRIRVRRQPRSCAALAAQGLEPRVTGPEFFVIDFTEDKGDGARPLPAPARAGAGGGPTTSRAGPSANRSPTRGTSARRGRW